MHTMSKFEDRTNDWNCDSLLTRLLGLKRQTSMFSRKKRDVDVSTFEDEMHVVGFRVGAAEGGGVSMGSLLGDELQWSMTE